jgi:biotin carboxylase
VFVGVLWGLSEMNKIVAIVDGYRLGNLFAPKLAKLGYDCVHIQSEAVLHKNFVSSYKAEDYVANIVYDNNLGHIVGLLKNMNVKFVIPGHEKGVLLADIISEKLGVITNGTKVSEARRDKYEMQEALKRHGIATSRYFVAKTINEAVGHAKAIGSWPVVIKPLASVGGEGVTFCYSIQEVEDACAKIINTENFLGLNNDRVLIQSLMQGDEYMVNTVSIGGKHFLVDVWFCKKYVINHTIVNDYFKLIPYNHAVIPILKEYVFKVLNALEIRHGAAHTEITVTAEGPLLMEIGARVMGSVRPDWISEAKGCSQLDMTIDSYVKPDKYENFSEGYTIKKHVLVKFIIPSANGVIKKIRHLDCIEKLKSFYKLNLHSSVGSKLDLAYELFAVPGMVVLMHEDDTTIMSDYEQLCELEKTMFVVE